MQQLPTFPTVSPDDGVERTVLSEAPELMVVSFRFKTGAEGKLHNHPHVQSTYVASGSFRFYRDGEAYDLQKGDSLIIPGHVEHGCLCLEEGELIDCFTRAATTFSEPGRPQARDKSRRVRGRLFMHSAPAVVTRNWSSIISAPRPSP